MKAKPTKKAAREEPAIRPEYDFHNGIKGKYATRYKEGTNIVALDRDVAEFFPDSDSVNKALRPIAAIMRKRLKEQDEEACSE